MALQVQVMKQERGPNQNILLSSAHREERFGVVKMRNVKYDLS